MNSGTLLSVPISFSIRSTASLAPPCSGPYNAAAAPASAEYGSTCELPIVRIVVVAEPLHELLDVLVEHRVQRDLARPRLQLRLGGELAEKNQVGGFEVVAVLGQLLDRIAAIEEDPLVAVDERDGAPAVRRVH